MWYAQNFSNFSYDLLPQSVFGENNRIAEHCFLGVPKLRRTLRSQHSGPKRAARFMAGLSHWRQNDLIVVQSCDRGSPPANKRISASRFAPQMRVVLKIFMRVSEPLGRCAMLRR